MISYADKRNRYAGQAQWSVSPGQARGDNPVQHPEPTSNITVRAPRGAFRVSTTTDEALLQAQGEAEALKDRAQKESSLQAEQDCIPRQPQATQGVVFESANIFLNVAKPSGVTHDPPSGALETSGLSIADVMGGEE